MTSTRRLLLLLGSVLPLLACSGVLEDQPFRDASCRCTVDAPVLWVRQELVDEPHLGLGTAFTDQYLIARFLPKSGSDSVSSPITLLDAYMADDLALPVDLGDQEIIDGRTAAVRTLDMPDRDVPVRMWVAMVPYPDGHLWLMAWAPLDQPAAFEQAVGAARTARRASAPWALPAGLDLAVSPPQPLLAARAALEGGVPTEHPPPPDPPEGLEATDYPSTVGPLPAWASPQASGPPRPGVLYLAGGFDGHTHGTASDLDAFRDAGLAVYLPHVRGQAGMGPHELLGGELDDALVALETFRARPDVDPDRVYVLGYGTGSPLALLLAEATDSPRAVIAIEGVTDLGLVRRDFPDLFGTGAYPADPEQDALRSPARFVGQLTTPTWAFHSEFSDDTLHGELMAAAAHRTDAPFHWHLVPRAGESWGSHLLDHLAEHIPLDTGPEVDLGFDDEGLRALARAEWSDRVAELEAASDRVAETLWHGHHLADAGAVVEAVVAARGVIDGRLPRERARAVVQSPRSPATPDREKLDAVRAALATEGIALRMPMAWADLETELPEAERPKGFVIASTTDLVEAGAEGSLALSYGDRVERTDAGTVKVGERVVEALEAAGLTVTWSGDPDRAIVVDGVWFAPSVAAAP